MSFFPPFFVCSSADFSRPLFLKCFPPPSFPFLFLKKKTFRYPVTFAEFKGGHQVPTRISNTAVTWFVSDAAPVLDIPAGLCDAGGGAGGSAAGPVAGP